MPPACSIHWCADPARTTTLFYPFFVFFPLRGRWLASPVMFVIFSSSKTSPYKRPIQNNFTVDHMAFLLFKNHFDTARRSAEAHWEESEIHVLTGPVDLRICKVKYVSKKNINWAPWREALQLGRLLLILLSVFYRSSIRYSAAAPLAAMTIVYLLNMLRCNTSSLTSPHFCVCDLIGWTVQLIKWRLILLFG